MARHAKKNIFARLPIYMEWNLSNVACLWHNRSRAVRYNYTEQGWDKNINGHQFSTFHYFRNSLSPKRAVFYISE